AQRQAGAVAAGGAQGFRLRRRDVDDVGLEVAGRLPSGRVVLHVDVGAQVLATERGGNFPTTADDAVHELLLGRLELAGADARSARRGAGGDGRAVLVAHVRRRRRRAAAFDAACEAGLADHDRVVGA